MHTWQSVMLGNHQTSLSSLHQAPQSSPRWSNPFDPAHYSTTSTTCEPSCLPARCTSTNILIAPCSVHSMHVSTFMHPVCMTRCNLTLARPHGGVSCCVVHHISCLVAPLLTLLCAPARQKPLHLQNGVKFVITYSHRTPRADISYKHELKRLLCGTTCRCFLHPVTNFVIKPTYTSVLPFLVSSSTGGPVLDKVRPVCEFSLISIPRKIECPAGGLMLTNFPTEEVEGCNLRDKSWQHNWDV